MKDEKYYVIAKVPPLAQPATHAPHSRKCIGTMCARCSAGGAGLFFA